MPPFKFITDPSLLRKDSRSRNLLQSAANSHVAKYNHQKRRRNVSHRNRSGHGYEWLCLCQSNQPCPVHSGSDVMEIPASLKSWHSDYLQQKYGGKNETLVNTLISYYINVVGPIYVWNFPDIDNRATAHRNTIMRRIMTEPAQAEVSLAWVHWLVNPKPPGEYSVEMLHHQTRSYSLITNALGQQEKLQDYSLLLSIGSHMVLNRACRDWSSYEVNLKGLNQLLTLLGGVETLKNTYSLGYSYILSLQKAFTDRSVHADADVRPIKRSVLLRSIQPTSSLLYSLPSEVLPDGLISLVEQGEMRHDIAVCLSEAIGLLGKLRSGAWFTASSTSPKLTMEVALLDLLESHPLMFAEYTLCAGLLISLIWTPPSVEIREGLWSDPLASWLVPEFAEAAMATDLAALKAPVLWTCLAMMEMPVIVGPNLSSRLSLLRDIVLKVSGQMSWPANRKMLASIYMDAKFETVWSKCWEKLIHPRPLDPSSMWTSSYNYG